MPDEKQYQRIRFGTSGFRGRWGIEFTEHTARSIAQAICDYLASDDDRPGNVITIGYDSREHADEVAMWCAEVALRNGFSVHLTSRDTPTPTLAYYARHELGDASAGVVNCTCSHNPIDWQGIKFSLYDGAISPPVVTDFVSTRATEYQNGERTPPQQGSVSGERLERVDPLSSYCDWLLQSGESDCRIRLDHRRMRAYYRDKLVIVDEMHGTGRGYLRYLLDAIGVSYHVIHGERSPQLGGLRAANPEEPHIDALKQAVRDRDAVLGVGLDTDADRYGIVDRGGVYRMPNAILAMLTHYLGVERGLSGRIATTNVTTHLLESIGAAIPDDTADRPAAGAKPMHLRNPEYRTLLGDPGMMITKNVFTVLTGLKYIIQAAQMDAQYRVLDPPPDNWMCRLLIGGEEASGLTTRGHVPDKDGIWADLLVLDMVAYYGKPLGEIWDYVQSIYGPSYTGRLNLPTQGGLAQAVADEAMRERRLAGLEVVYAGQIGPGYAEFRLRSSDGSLENYLHVRLSGTEPLVRVYAEATTEERLTGLLEAVRVLSEADRSM